MKLSVNCYSQDADDAETAEEPHHPHIFFKSQSFLHFFV